MENEDMAPPKATVGTLQLMHADNQRRITKVEEGQAVLLSTTTEIRLSVARVETMLRDSAKLDSKIQLLEAEIAEIKETVDRTRGMGTLAALGLTALNGMVAVYTVLKRG